VTVEVVVKRLRRLKSAMVLALVAVTQAVQADEVRLVCKGTYYFHKSDLPQRATTESVAFVIDRDSGTFRVEGTMHANATGPLSIEDGFYWSVMAHPNEADGVSYPYVRASVSRTTGEAVILPMSKPSLDDAGPIYFSGVCSQQNQLF
jgi:hypothetical protein